MGGWNLSKVREALILLMGFEKKVLVCSSKDCVVELLILIWRMAMDDERKGMAKGKGKDYVSYI